MGTISAIVGGDEAAGEAGGERSECSDGEANPQCASEEEETDPSDIFSEKKKR